jgi:hypothetical protein
LYDHNPAFVVSLKAPMLSEAYSNQFFGLAPLLQPGRDGVAGKNIRKGEGKYGRALGAATDELSYLLFADATWKSACSRLSRVPWVFYKETKRAATVPETS